MVNRHPGTTLAAAAIGILLGTLLLRLQYRAESPIPSPREARPEGAPIPGPASALQRSLEEDLEAKLRRLSEAKAGGTPSSPVAENAPLAGRHFLEASLKSWRGAECRRLQKDLDLTDNQRVRIERIILGASAAIWREVYAEKLETEGVVRAAEEERSFLGKVAGVLTEDQRAAFQTRWDPHWHILTGDRPQDVREFLGRTELDDSERASVLDDLRTWFVAEKLLFTRYSEMGEPPDEYERRRKALLDRTVERLKPKVSPLKMAGLQEQLRTEDP